MPPYTTPAKRDTIKNRPGVQNDLAQRMNDAGAYRPGAGPKMAQGFGNPITQIGGLVSKIVKWGRGKAAGK